MGRHHAGVWRDHACPGPAWNQGVSVYPPTSPPHLGEQFMPKLRSLRRSAALLLAISSWLVSSLRSQTLPPAPPIMLGTAWYPEQWPESRWDDDLSLMQQAGIHMVRVGEFAWSRMEPSEGHYDLDWLDRAITAAAKHHIVSVVGTPTATPPAWLTLKHPETLRVDEE